MVKGYSDYPGFGWCTYGRLVVNYTRTGASTIFYNGTLIWERPR